MDKDRHIIVSKSDNCAHDIVVGNENSSILFTRLAFISTLNISTVVLNYFLFIEKGRFFLFFFNTFSSYLQSVSIKQNFQMILITPST